MVELAAKSSRRASAQERRRRAEALKRHRATGHSHEALGGELQYLRTQLQVAAELATKLASTNEVAEMARLVVNERPSRTRSTV